MLILISLLYSNSNSFFKYETIVSRNGLSLGYSELDTSSVCSVVLHPYTTTQWDQKFYDFAFEFLQSTSMIL